MNAPLKQIDFAQLAEEIKTWGRELGFNDVGITDPDVSAYTEDFKQWLAQHFHGEMDYMARHAELRCHPEQLVPGTLRIITVRLNYLPPHTGMVKTLQNPNKGYVSRYAVGGDYHKFIRKRLEKLASKITETVGTFGYRAFTDSAPILEKPLAEKSGLGWIGKNTLLLNREAGSWFFLGELFTDLPLPINTQKASDHCGHCKACLQICPTQAFVAPYQLDARRCISYLTIEHKSTIPEALRPLMGNRIYGCDDCQLICPWNRYAVATRDEQFKPKHGLEDSDLIQLFLQTEQEFEHFTRGSAIRRIGYERWLRNIAVALGNAPSSPEIIQALSTKQDYPSELVREHVQWALAQHENKTNPTTNKKLSQTTKLNPLYD